MKIGFKLNKLRSNIFIYFFIFTVLLVFLIWLLQTVFFEANYRASRESAMNGHAEVLISSIEQNGVVDNNYVVSLHESGIRAVLLKKDVLNEIEFLYPTTENQQELLKYKPLYLSVMESLDTKGLSKSSGELKVGTLSPMIFSATKTRIDGQDLYLILLSSINSFSDTVQVLKMQLLTVAVVVLIVSLALSWFIAGKLSKPIDKMSEVAEKWANGDTSLSFEGGGYMEMDKLAKTLNYAKSEISKAENLQRDLLANVSHDLKTPLTMIKAYAEMIQDISGENKQKRDKHTKVIIDEADRLTLLVNDILTLSRIQSSVDVIEKKEFNLSDMVESVLYRFETAIEKDGYKFEKDIDKGLTIFADEKKIEEVIYNLVGNSINYTGEDKLVKVYLKNNGEHALFEILDSGLGMNKEQIDGIWEKYYRNSSTHHRAVKGTGLGLSIVKTILTAHNYDFGVISKSQVGSNFYVKFNLVNNLQKGEEDNE